MAAFSIFSDDAVIKCAMSQGLNLGVWSNTQNESNRPRSWKNYTASAERRHRANFGECPLLEVEPSFRLSE
jgi:hypothetical protein